jgi:hypothetical protein
MKRAQAQKAIDHAFADGLKRLFMMLETNLLDQNEKSAMARFEKGLAKFDQAHSLASSVIEKVFPE